MLKALSSFRAKAQITSKLKKATQLRQSVMPLRRNVSNPERYRLSLFSAWQIDCI
jgi:hypothetical protein